MALALAWVCGLTFGGFFALVMETVTGRPVGFRRPFVGGERIGASLCLTLLAGPYMLANEALEALRDARIGAWMAAGCAVTAGVWALSTGIVVLWLAEQAVR